MVDSLVNWKRFGRKTPRLNEGTIQTFALGGTEENPKSIRFAGIPHEIRTEHFRNTTLRQPPQARFGFVKLMVAGLGTRWTVGAVSQIRRGDEILAFAVEYILKSSRGEMERITHWPRIFL